MAVIKIFITIGIIGWWFVLVIPFFTMISAMLGSVLWGGIGTIAACAVIWEFLSWLWRR